MPPVARSHPIGLPARAVPAAPLEQAAARCDSPLRGHLGNVGSCINWYKGWGQGEEKTSEHGTL